MTLLSAPDVARFLGVSLRTFHLHVRAALQPVKIGRCVRFLPNSETTEHCTTLMEPLAITASQPDGKCRRQPTSSNGRLAVPVRGGSKGASRG